MTISGIAMGYPERVSGADPHNGVTSFGKAVENLLFRPKELFGGR